MQFTIRGEKMTVTPAIRNYAEEKISKIERYFDERVQANAHVNLKIQHKNAQKVEVTIPISGLVLRAEETNQDLYAAIDLVVDKLERQIRKHKTKMNRKFREKGQTYSTFNDTVAAETEEESAITRVKTFELTPMTAEEAVLQMNMLGHDFYLFFDGDSGKTCAVYRRNQHDYGLIETVQ